MSDTPEPDNKVLSIAAGIANNAKETEPDKPWTDADSAQLVVDNLVFDIGGLMHKVLDSDFKIDEMHEGPDPLTPEQIQIHQSVAPEKGQKSTSNCPV